MQTETRDTLDQIRALLVWLDNVPDAIGERTFDALRETVLGTIDMLADNSEELRIAFDAEHNEQDDDTVLEFWDAVEQRLA